MSTSTEATAQVFHLDSLYNWRDDGLCAQTDPEAFFPNKGESVAPAKAICARCPVIDRCLEYALDNDERFGVWGGTSERERRRLRRHREAKAS